jgi:hypothetical protein
MRRRHCAGLITIDATIVGIARGWLAGFAATAPDASIARAVI